MKKIILNVAAILVLVLGMANGCEDGFEDLQVKVGSQVEEVFAVDFKNPTAVNGWDTVVIKNIELPSDFDDNAIDSLELTSATFTVQNVEAGGGATVDLVYAAVRTDTRSMIIPPGFLFSGKLDELSTFTIEGDDLKPLADALKEDGQAEIQMAASVFGMAGEPLKFEVKMVLDAVGYKPL